MCVQSENIKYLQNYRLSFLLFILSASTLAKEVLGSPTMTQKCFVCLPLDKTSLTGMEILELFKKYPKDIPTCASFTSNQYLSLDCPPDYKGCMYRINGSDISRSCARYSFDDCKTANGVEICYCSDYLCNTPRKRPMARSIFSGVEHGDGEVMLKDFIAMRSINEMHQDDNDVDEEAMVGDLLTDDEDILMGNGEGGSGEMEGDHDPKFKSTFKESDLKNSDYFPNQSSISVPLFIPRMSSSFLLIFVFLCR